MHKINVGLYHKRICSLIFHENVAIRCCSNVVSEEARRQNELFALEKKRQTELVGRIEKIEVQYEGVPKNATLIMNKNISTPYDCAKHLGEMLKDRSAVALINGETLWHMHKPIPDNCKLELLHCNMVQPAAVNKVFWRTCSFLLGALVNNAFKDKIDVQLHSFPIPNVKSGSFVYDVQLSLADWQPTQSELRSLSLQLIRFCQQNHRIQSIEVDEEFALLMFRNNRHKTQQIPDIASNNSGKVTLFKAGTHVDISKGPMMANTNQLGRTTISNVIKLSNATVDGYETAPLYRFQGVALPRSIILNHFAYNLLEERAKRLNPARIPTSQEITHEDHSFVASLSA